MALNTMGTTATTSLKALKFTAAVVPADMASLNAAIADDQWFVNTYTGKQSGIVLSGTTSSVTNPTIITSVTVSSPSGALVTGLGAGTTLYGPGIPPGTVVVSTTATTITMSASATASATVTFFGLGRTLPGSFNTLGQLFIPNRGVLQLLPGDAIGVDASGWPVLVSKQSLAYSGTSWAFV